MLACRGLGFRGDSHVEEARMLIGEYLDTNSR